MVLPRPARGAGTLIPSAQHLTRAPSMSGWGLGARQMTLTPDLALQVEACLLPLEDPSLGS